jgi:hypothetical protein
MHEHPGDLGAPSSTQHKPGARRQGRVRARAPARRARVPSQPQAQHIEFYIFTIAHGYDAGIGMSVWSDKPEPAWLVGGSAAAVAQAAE